MTVPVEDHLWNPVPGIVLPEGCKIEVARAEDGTIIVRVTGPRAKEFADGPDYETAIDGVVNWLSQAE